MWSARKRQRAEEDARAAWLDAAALLEARSRADYKHVQDAHFALTETLTDLRADFARRDAHLSATLTQLGGVCSSLAERIDADREERHELVQTITALAAALVERIDLPAPHVIGGSVYGDDRNGADGEASPATIDLTAVDVGAQPRAAGNAPEHDDTATAAPTPGDEVRCRFGDRWVDGFEILEVHSREGRARCRVRRRSDGSIVRKLFETRDLEIVSPAAKRPPR
jgi:ABC-type transporter Mla subunit MlaD